jgi:hypothetical protein
VGTSRKGKGKKERVKGKRKCSKYFILKDENRTVKPAEIVLRREEGNEEL